MVEDVEEREVGVLLLEEEDGRVRHVQDLGGVEHPGHGQRPHRLGGPRVVHGLAAPAVVATHVETGEHPTVQQARVTAQQKIWEPSDMSSLHYFLH